MVSPILAKFYQVYLERICWAKTLLILGEGKRDEVFRKFLDLKKDALYLQLNVCLKRGSMPVTLHVYLWDQKPHPKKKRKK